MIIGKKNFFIQTVSMLIVNKRKNSPIFLIWQIIHYKSGRISFCKWGRSFRRCHFFLGSGEETIWVKIEKDKFVKVAAPVQG